MNDLTDFIPEKSAEKCKKLFRSKTIADIELISELYKARLYYTNSGFRSDLVTNDTRFNTFEKYLQYIEIDKRAVYRKFERYIPEENKLLTFEELQQKKQIEIENKKSEEQKKKEAWHKRYIEREKLFKKYYEIGVDPILENEEDKIAYKKYKDLQDFLKKEKEKISEKVKSEKYENVNIDELFKETDKYLKQEQIKIEERLNYNSKVKDLNTLYDVIEDYLMNMNSSQKLECYNNIIRYCKKKAIELNIKA